MHRDLQPHHDEANSCSPVTIVICVCNVLTIHMVTT